MDSTIRQRQRRGEVTALDMVRAGWVSRERIDLAEQVRAGGWTWDERRRLIGDAAELLGEALPARLAADYAARLPQPEAGAAAIAAARAWAAEPTEARRRTAVAAYSAAGYYSAAAYAAYAAHVAAAFGRGCAADEAYAAARAAAYAAAPADREAEHHWQRERLAIYLESPGWPNPVEVTRG